MVERGPIESKKKHEEAAEHGVHDENVEALARDFLKIGIF
jgi:hypothetical protein